MNNKRNKIFLTGTSFMIIGLLTGCGFFDLGTEYCQYTPDELSHLYFDRDSLVYDGNSIDYYDTIAFLHNSEDTMLVKVHTSIYSWAPPYGSIAEYLNGTSRMYFDEQTGFQYAQVRVSKVSKYSDADIFMDFVIINGGCSDVKMNVPLDTALVLGKTYNNVYKFEFTVNSPSKLKSIYFAKKYGFIKVEVTDGRKLERLELNEP